ncbi:MAG TPA: chloride channel protein, partial [Puia sp.]|nr:chloride channel protein [Puia sp.]
FFPSLEINPAMAALVGMAAMFAGASRALLTSIVFALETTGQSNGLLPILGACVAAYFISFFLMKGSIMTEKIIRRGVRTPDSYEPDILQGQTVKQLLTPIIPSNKADQPFIFASDDASLAAELMGRHHTDTLVVLDNKENRNRIGAITSASILAYYSRQKRKEHTYSSPNRTRRILVHGRKFLHISRSVQGK